MKRLTFAAAVMAGLALVLAPAAQAQGGLGIKFGLDASRTSNYGTLQGNLHARTGLTVGLGYESGAPVGFGVDALYSQQGLDGPSVSQNRKIDYLDVPVYLRVRFPTAMAPFIYAGPQVGFELKCQDGRLDCRQSDRPHTTYSGIVGAGVHIPAGFTVEARYQFGFTNLKLNDTPGITTDYKDRTFSLLVGLGFL
jgi:hypothetical protein